MATDYHCDRTTHLTFCISSNCSVKLFTKNYNAYNFRKVTFSCNFNTTILNRSSDKSATSDRM